MQEVFSTVSHYCANTDCYDSFTASLYIITHGNIYYYLSVRYTKANIQQYIYTSKCTVELVGKRPHKVANSFINIFTSNMVFDGG